MRVPGPYLVLLILGGVAVMLAFLVMLVVGSWFGYTEVPRSGWRAWWEGDVDDDGIPDFVLSTPFESEDDQLRLFSGATGAEVRHVGFIPPAARWGDHPMPGDLNGDGRNELWREDGSDHVVSDGRTGAIIQTFPCEWSELCEVLDDFDGDGFKELLLGGFPPGNDGMDRVSAVDVRRRAALWTVERPRPKRPPYPTFGRHGCVPGDLDADGFVDAAVVDEGERIEFLSGRDGRTIGRSDLRCSQAFGSLSALGDVDGDGRPEILVQDSFEKWASVVSCSDGRVLRHLPHPCDVFGYYSPGDLDGDGQWDVAWSNEEGARCAQALGALIGQWPGVQLMPGKADHDQDGRADLLAVRNVTLRDGTYAPGLWRQGRVEIISGKTLAVVRTFDADSLGLPR